MGELRKTESLVSSVLDHPLIVARIASFLPPPFVCLELRLVSKSLPQYLDHYDVVNVAEGMSGEDCIAALAVARSELTLSQRQHFLSVTAAVGDIEMLERVAEAAGCFLGAVTIAAAARAGQLACCQRLVEMGCPEQRGLVGAASGGQREVCEWFLGRGALLTSMEAAVVAAASGGHVELMDKFCQKWAQDSSWRYPPPEKARHLLLSVARACDQETLHYMCSSVVACLWEADAKAALHAQAAGSPTPDWQDKLVYLAETASAPPCSAAVCEAAARCPGAEAVSRLQWLQQRGYPVTHSGVVSAAAASGNLEAFSWLREQGAPLPGRPVTVKLEGEAHALQSLRDVLPGLMEAGCPVDYFPTALHAAQRGDRKGVAWVVERFPAQPPPGMAPADYPGLLEQAAACGSVQLMAWIKGWGAELHPDLWEAAIKAVCEAALDWLRDNGCPMPEAEDCPEHLLCVIDACDVSTLRTLLRLGFPVAPDAWELLASRGTGDRKKRKRARPALQMLQLILENLCIAKGSADKARWYVAQLGDAGARKGLFACLKQLQVVPPANQD